MTSATIPAGELRIYELQYRAVLHRQGKIRELDPTSHEIGYTNDLGEIYLSGAHPLIRMLPEEQQPFFRCGVFVHETLHQIYTDFNYAKKKYQEYQDRSLTRQAQVLSLFVNLVEDPAIEYFAPLIYGGYLLSSLRFSIRHIYRQAPELSEGSGAFEQLVNALIMFGDMGLLKGRFTEPEAEELFYQIIPSFNKAVTNPSSKERINVAEQWTEMTRPLWEKEKDVEDIIERIRRSGMGENAEPCSEDDAPEPETPSEKPEQTPETERREQFSKELKRALGCPTGGFEEEDTSITSGTPGAGDGDSEEKSDPDQSNNIRVTETADKEDVLKKYTKTAREIHEEIEAEDAEMSWQIAEFLEVMEMEMKKNRQKEEAETLDLPVKIPRANGKSDSALKVLNLRPHTDQSDENEYKKVLSNVNRDSRILTNALKNLFRADYEEMIHATTGKYAIKRDLTHTNVKIFDKKKDKKNTDDMAVVLLVDMSGSMHGQKIALARNCTITMAETFAALKIPCHIMGFTADVMEADVVHAHFVTWTNTPKERVSLMRISANANNDDGYSIRYATQLLKKKNAEHKILFVLSDGAPACHRYRKTDGLKDTASAILEARKSGVSIFGIGIGVVTYDILKEMYKGDYINVRNTQELTAALAKQLKRTIKRF